MLDRAVGDIAPLAVGSIKYTSTKGAYSLGKTPGRGGSAIIGVTNASVRKGCRQRGSRRQKLCSLSSPSGLMRQARQPTERRKRALQQQGRINAKRPVLDAQSEGVDEEGSSDMMQTSPAKVQVKQEASDTSWWGQTRQSFGKFMRS